MSQGPYDPDYYDFDEDGNPEYHGRGPAQEEPYEPDGEPEWGVWSPDLSRFLTRRMTYDEAAAAGAHDDPTLNAYARQVCPAHPDAEHAAEDCPTTDVGGTVYVDEAPF